MSVNWAEMFLLPFSNPVAQLCRPATQGSSRGIEGSL